MPTSAISSARLFCSEIHTEAAAIGKCSSTSRPPPDASPSVTSPPLALTMRRTIASPSPQLPRVRARRVDLGEGFEGTLALLGRNAIAVIADLERDETGSLDAPALSRPAARRTAAHCRSGYRARVAGCRARSPLGGRRGIAHRDFDRHGPTRAGVPPRRSPRRRSGSALRLAPVLAAQEGEALIDDALHVVWYRGSRPSRSASLSSKARRTRKRASGARRSCVRPASISRRSASAAGQLVNHGVVPVRQDDAPRSALPARPCAYCLHRPPINRRAEIGQRTDDASHEQAGDQQQGRQRAAATATDRAAVSALETRRRQISHQRSPLAMKPIHRPPGWRRPSCRRIDRFVEFVAEPLGEITGESKRGVLRHGRAIGTSRNAVFVESRPQGGVAPRRPARAVQFASAGPGQRRNCVVCRMCATSPFFKHQRER